MHPSFHTSMRHDHASDLFKIRIHVQCFQKKLFKKVLDRHVRLLEQVDMVGVGLRGQQEGGGGQLLLLWPVMATEGASQSDFVPVTTGDPRGCPVGQGLAPHQPTLSGLLQLAAAVILLQHYDEFHDIFRSVWSLMEFDQKQQRVNGGRENTERQSTFNNGIPKLRISRSVWWRGCLLCS